MLRSGAEHLERLRDGRVVYLGDERVEDVTTHPAFAEAARTVAAIYDLGGDPALTDEMSFEEGGERFAMHFLPARTQNDLRRRMAAHRRIADLTYGMFGRSPDHFGGYVTALAAMPEVLDGAVRGFPAHLSSYYRYVRQHDHFVCYAVLPPQAARDPAFYQRQNLDLPTLQVVDEDEGGIWISGMKMLATGAVFADEIWIGNIQPLAPDQKRQAVTCAIPVNAPGVSLWSR
jgi:4-hydroxyphenylacetate 3-monooxygenase